MGVVCLYICPPLSDQLTDGPHQPSVPDLSSEQIMRERERDGYRKRNRKDKLKRAGRMGTVISWRMR